MALIEVRTEIQRVREVKETVVEVTCDYCGSEKVDYSGRINQCSVCKKDICRDHQRFWYQDPFSAFDYGDYPPRVCLECDSAVAQVRQLCGQINHDHDLRIEAIEKNWRESRHMKVME